MAGAGYKSWVDGDILTAADVNTYLMQQAVMRFADSAARTSAIAAPSEGMVTYLVDTDRIEYYDGAAWQPILDQDVIEAKGDLIVGTADDTVARLAVGTNEHRLVADSGQSTGLKYVADTTNYAIAAKGDLLAGTAADTLAALSVGTDGYILTADSAEATGLKWAAAAAGGGKILQVVQATYATETSSTSTSLVDTGLSGTITPTSATSKILVIANQSVYTLKTSTASVGGGFKLLRNSTAVLDSLGAGQYGGIYMQAGTALLMMLYRASFVYLDSPATTSATTYKTQMAAEAAGFTIGAQANNTTSTIIMIEVGA